MTIKLVILSLVNNKLFTFYIKVLHFKSIYKIYKIAGVVFSPSKCFQGGLHVYLQLYNLFFGLYKRSSAWCWCTSRLDFFAGNEMFALTVMTESQKEKEWSQME